MKTVKQERFGQCGAACLAMVLEEPLSEVVASLEATLNAPLHEIGVADGEMVEHLRDRGFDRAQVTMEWDGSEEAILTVPSLNHRGILHYIVWDGSQYLDPSTGPLTYPEDAPVIGGRKQVCWATAIIWSQS
jgi:ABC-type bacteriocin/lantibiotic exporter with double-glycine peptidase domain